MKYVALPLDDPNYQHEVQFLIDMYGFMPKVWVPVNIRFGNTKLLYKLSVWA